MRIHTDTLTSTDMYNATDAATRAVGGNPAIKAVRPTKMELHKSRSRRHAYEVLLTGSNSRGQNGDPRTPAATYDEWGFFLAYLFAKDPEMTCTYYTDADDFDAKTEGKYRHPANVWYCAGS